MSPHPLLEFLQPNSDIEEYEKGHITLNTLHSKSGNHVHKMEEVTRRVTDLIYIDKEVKSDFLENKIKI